MTNVTGVLTFVYMETLPQDKIVEVFYDGDCPLCNREINILRWLDRKSRIQFTDIAVPIFQPENYGKTMTDFMSHIHGRNKDGNWIEGVEVFRQLYAAVGFGPLILLTRIPVISHLLEWFYGKFAKNRLRWTGRCDDNCKIE